MEQQAKAALAMGMARSIAPSSRSPLARFSNSTAADALCFEPNSIPKDVLLARKEFCRGLNGNKKKHMLLLIVPS